MGHNSRMITFQNLSFWEKETFINHTDYLIVGSGIVGLSTAIYLKQREKHKKVTVLERGFLPTGASTKNAGFSCIGSPSELMDDLTKNSAEQVFETVQKRWQGLNNLKSLLGEKNIDYLELGSHELFLPQHNNKFENCISSLDKLNEQLKNITGISNVFQEANEIIDNYGFAGFSKAISHKAEGQINTGMMMKSLVKKAQEMDVQLLNGIEVKEINTTDLETNFGRIGFKKLAICTNGFSKRFFPSEDVVPARAQVIVTEEISNLKLKGIFHFDEGFYYFRNIGNRILFGGGRNLAFKEEETEELKNTELIINKLKTVLHEQIIPDQTVNIEHQWAGTMGVGQAKFPIIKEVDNHIFCGIRLGGMGVAIGSVVGKELAELMSKS